MTVSYSRLSRVLLIALVLALPARAHDAAPAVALATAAVTASGTVTELIVENRLNGATFRYLGLRLDDGRSFALAGVGLDALDAGQRIDATGTLSGRTLTLAWFTPVAAAGRARIADATPTSSVSGAVAIYHMDFFDQGRGEYGLAV